MVALGRAAAELTAEEVDAVTSPWEARGLIPALVAISAAFGAWSLLLPVVPTAVIDAGGSESLAGMSTGVFMFSTVATQVFVPRLLRKYGYRRVILVASVLLSLPALGYIAGMSAPLVLGIGVIRGIGFGALSVAESATIAQLVPWRLLGRTTGIFGVAVGAVQMAALPAGLGLAGIVGYGPVYVLAAVIGAVGMAACLWIPAIQQPEAEGEHGSGLQVPVWRLVAVPMLALTFVTTAYGAVTTFLPAGVRELDPASGAVFAGVLLAVVNFAAMLARYFAGAMLDRRGVPGTVMIPFQISAALGILATAAVLYTEASVWWLVPASLLYGAGFGAVQNESLTQLFYRLPHSKASEASAMWNIAFDAGTGLGSTIYGLMLAGMSMAPMFGIAGAVIAVGVVVTVADRVLGRHRVSEVNNLSVRLRSVQAPRFYRRGGR
ncbi:Major Facilitator Superfamily protein [Corynebacterium capitovis DSM 44611]|uniref:MFS transporter n=1 Tax=Corynebacterium capitovis TaxID=131081 RepID=UPI00037C4122|nr:MFS transporter [Corynebacterium capitovis]WKD57406.1 Major Facilitator Superfamily protein [Corynebacterium capitovis DSM 44611]